MCDEILSPAYIFKYTMCQPWPGLMRILPLLLIICMYGTFTVPYICTIYIFIYVLSISYANAMKETTEDKPSYCAG